MFEWLKAEDNKRIDEWIKNGHLKCAHTYTGAIGGFIEFFAIPTSIGLIYGVKCLVCKTDKLDLSDYASW